MELLFKIRLKAGQCSLRKKASLVKREKIVHNFNTAKKACVIFDASFPDGFQHITKFRKYLSSHNINSIVVGYVDADEVPGELILWKNCHFISKKDLDLIFRPKKSQMFSVMQENFDILFDLSLTYQFPIQYFSVLTTAEFKVGKFTDIMNDFDLMINIKEDQTIEYFIEQIIHYVNMLNKSVELS